MTPGEREQRALENLEAWAARGDARVKRIATIQTTRLLPGLHHPLFDSQPTNVTVRRAA